MRALPVFLIIAGLAFPVAARADDAAVLYDPSEVALVDLTLSDDAQQALIDEPSEYVVATFALELGGLTYGPETVEVRLKGHGTFRPLGKKSAFKVKFPKANRLLGLKSMTLNNMVQDTSMLHETLGYEILRAAGVPAPRTGFAYVRVNDKRYGLYLDIETYDDISMKRRFDSTQHLFEADDNAVDVRPGGAGAFEVEEGDEDDLADLQALIDATNATGGDWSDGMAASADLGELTRMWAGEQFLGHWDGYSVRDGALWPKNYYLHSDDSGRFSMLPSGIDQTFVERSAFPGASPGLLAANCRADSSCLDQLRSGLGAVSAATDTLGAGTRLNALAATVAVWRPCADLEHATDSAWHTAVLGTRAFLRERRKDVAGYLGSAAPAPVPALESTTPPPLSTAGCPLDPPPPVDEEPGDPEPSPSPTPVATNPVATVGVAGATASQLRPRRLTAHTRLRRAARRLTAWGSLLLPAGVGRAGRCGGFVAVRVRAGGRTIAKRRTPLRFDCTYATTFKLKPRAKLAVQARFEGTSALLATKTVSTRPRP